MNHVTPTDAQSASEAAGTPVAAGAKVRAGRAAWLRAAALLVALVPLSLLAVASRLEPDSRGLGTHQQLGLPPCSMRLMFGIRCPGCGMTTSWTHFMHGQWAQSATVNPGGFLLALFSLGVAAIALRITFTGHLPSPRTQAIVTAAAVGILIVAIVHWLTHLHA